MKAQKHACFHVYFPFSAYFYPHYTIRDKGHWQCHRTVACDVQRDGKLKELADELEMALRAPITLLRRWRYEIKNGLEAHSLLVYHLKCIGLAETSDR